MSGRDIMSVTIWFLLISSVGLILGFGLGVIGALLGLPHLIVILGCMIFGGFYFGVGMDALFG